MSIHKKNIIILVLLDLAYLLLSMDIILSYYILDSVRWYAYIPFSIVLVIGIVGFFIYRRNNEAVLPISKRAYTLTRVLTLAFLIVYVIQMIIVPNPQDYQAVFSILIGSFLAAIGLSALILHCYILIKGHQK